MNKIPRNNTKAIKNKEQLEIRLAAQALSLMGVGHGELRPISQWAQGVNGVPSGPDIKTDILVQGRRLPTGIEITEYICDAGPTGASSVREKKCWQEVCNLISKKTNKEPIGEDFLYRTFLSGSKGFPGAKKSDLAAQIRDFMRETFSMGSLGEFTMYEKGGFGEQYPLIEKHVDSIQFW